ncbi:MAG: acetylxylan esterase [Polyangiales bacterium]
MKTSWLVAGLSLALVQCGGEGGAPRASRDGGACAAANPAGCRYLGAMAYPMEALAPATLSYTDESGDTRTIRVQVRRPVGARGPLPVVVWSHGGADGTSNPTNVGAGWDAVFTRAGYLFVAIAHSGRDVASRARLCSALGYDTAGCMTFKYLSWDRPHDLRRVLDWLQEQAVGAQRGNVDLTRIAYAGHSAGAGAALVVAGATREIAGSQRALPDPRPVAFLSCSPQGPGEEGFVEGSFAGVARPHLTLTGAGDDTTGNVAEVRRRPFELMPAGQKYRGWIAEEPARHTIFDFSTSACEREGGTPERCAQYLDWLSSAGLAFLDAHVAGRPEAAAYLASDALTFLGGGAFEWSRR